MIYIFIHISVKKVPRNEPTKTLFVSNLPTCLPTPEVESKLKELFGAFGPINAILLPNQSHFSGCAFIVFNTLNDSTRAAQFLQGKEADNLGSVHAYQFRGEFYFILLSKNQFPANKNIIEQ